MSDRNILTAGLITLGSTTAASVLPESMGGKGEVPKVQLLVGTGLAFFGLSALSDVAPTIAQPLAIAIAMTAFVYYGGPLISNYLQSNGTTIAGKPIVAPTGRKANK